MEVKIRKLNQDNSDTNNDTNDVNNSNNECYHEFDFSQNSFDRSVKNWEIFKEIAHPLYGYVYIKTLDLSHNGFSEQEQQKMRLLLGDPECKK